MNRDEKEEFKEFITMTIQGSNAKLESQFDVIYLKLNNIEEQTKKTNGRVNKLEEKIILVEKDIDNFKSVKNFLAKSVAVAGVILGGIYTLLKVTGQIT